MTKHRAQATVHRPHLVRPLCPSMPLGFLYKIELLTSLKLSKAVIINHMNYCHYLSISQEAVTGRDRESKHKSMIQKATLRENPKHYQDEESESLNQEKGPFSSPYSNAVLSTIINIYLVLKCAQPRPMPFVGTIIYATDTKPNPIVWMAQVTNVNV